MGWEENFLNQVHQVRTCQADFLLRRPLQYPADGDEAFYDIDFNGCRTLTAVVAHLVAGGRLPQLVKVAGDDLATTPAHNTQVEGHESSP